ncbi:MAG: ATP-dependent Clp protease ATP-binding subunit ClpA [Acidobacteriota bacterium]
MFSPALDMVLTVALREAVARRHAHLTLEHLLYAIANDPTGERILMACGGDVAQIRKDLQAYLEEQLERLPAASRKEPAQTLAFQNVLRTAVLHVHSSGREEAEAGDVLAAILQQPKSYAMQVLDGQGIRRLDVLNFISHGISKVPLTENGSAEERGHVHADGEDGRSGKRDALTSYTVNLTGLARAGSLDPLVGREPELERTLQVLCRRRKNNPVFVGDPGVGKTALAEGLAQRIVEGTVPELLKDAEIFALDSGALLAGTRFRGDFEERFEEVIAALRAKPKPILFIDEVHTMVGAGATTGGTMDLANLLKPVLTAGDLRVIGSTTFEEYKHIERDRALARRLQKINVVEPTLPETVQICKGLKSRYEAHHGITYTDGALEAAARLAQRHLRDSRLPDSAIDVLDEAGAMLKVSPSDPPVTVIDVPEVERIIAKMARIPDRQASLSDKSRLKTLEESLQRVVFGQEAAVHQVSQAIKRSRAGLGQPSRPAGCFLFTGPTGVGKTELARQLALHLGNELHRYDMSEYMEKHAVSRLIGAPPGYVGFEQGGLLVDAVRQHPHSVVLLDEIEKAHPDLFNILLQVMDHATLTDNNGKKADFRQVVLIMTSNVGSREMAAASIGFSEDRKDAAKSRGKTAVERMFSPEFRNRLDAIVTFSALSPGVMETIVEKFILELEAQLEERRVAITLSPEARAYLGKKGYDPVYGARPLARVIQTEVRDPLTDELLFGKLENGGTVTIGLDESGEKLSFSCEPEPAPVA